ncbi:hypothetical protein MKX79_04200 [Viridibacillus sp. FSL R5-0468]|uniref:hypothetical protein n=1 Tax=Viridibacillus sp. FSL R5-0468 TaxID=2921640 RepID=UPI0030F50F27
MNIFQIKTKPHGADRLNEFIHGEFISIGWPGMGSLEGITKEELRERLKKVYYNEHYKGNPRGISVDLGNVWAFVDTMKPDDIVLFHGHQNNVHIVRVGPYKYVEELDNDQDAMCHQREFTLLKVVKFDELNSKLQELMRHRGTVTKFKYPLDAAELDLLLMGNIEDRNVKPDIVHPIDLVTRDVPEEIVKAALEVLYEALDSEDYDKRFKAAVEILRFVK